MFWVGFAKVLTLSVVCKLSLGDQLYFFTRPVPPVTGSPIIALSPRHIAMESARFTTIPGCIFTYIVSLLEQDDLVVVSIISIRLASGVVLLPVNVVVLVSYWTKSEELFHSYWFCILPTEPIIISSL